MPKSTTTRAPSAATNMFPGWRSPWKKPSRKTWLKKALAALARRSSMRWPAASSAARSSMRMPLIRSRVNTVRPVRRQSTRGTRKPGSPAKFSASSQAAAASKRRSISICTISASQKKRSRSRANASAMPGRSSLTATSCPSVVRAKCTWAIEAAATAVSSKSANRLATGSPNSASINARACRPGKGGRRSCRLARSAAISSPNRSARVDRIWPSLMKLGPSSLSAAASRLPGRGSSGPRRRASRRAVRSSGASAVTWSSGNSASWRASVIPMRHKRSRLRPARSGPASGRNASKTPGRMERSDAPQQIAEFDPLKPGFGDHRGERALPRKAPDALHEIAIRLALAGHDLAHQRHHSETVEIVERLQRRDHGGGEFEGEKAASGLQDAPRLGERRRDPRDIAQPEGDRVKIETAIGERQPLGVGDEPYDAREYAAVERAGAPNRQHSLADIADDGAAAAFRRQSRQCPQRDIAGAAGDVDEALARPRPQGGHHLSLPQAMDAAAHQIVHQIVAERHAVEQRAHPRRLFRLGNAAEAEIGLRACVVAVHRAGR